MLIRAWWQTSNTAADVFGLKNKLMIKNIFRKKTTVDPQKDYAEWIEKGKPSPPPHIVKQKTINEYREIYNIRVLVETGTYLGDMVEAQKNNFQQVYSIELSDKLYKKAVKRFSKNTNITLLQGDSSTKIAEVVAALQQPALFWLDGHYSGGITAKGDKECPIPEELKAIFESNEAHVILIDDARLFNGTHDYPNIDQIQSILLEHKKKYTIENRDDIIRLLPNTN
jgi:hypothetical protein